MAFSKEEFLTCVKQSTVKNCYIFGAGKIAGIVYDYLTQNNCSVQGFLVTSKQANKQNYKSLPVYDLNDFCFNKKNVQILIAVSERGEKKIQKMLQTQGFEHCVPLPDDILLCDETELIRYNSPIIEVTAKIGCAVNCRYCPQSLLINSYYNKDKNRKGEMSFEDFKFYLDKMPANTIVDFAGFVEPFLIADSIKMMEYVVQTGRTCNLYTTFRGLSLKDFDRLVKIPFKWVCVHTPDKDGHAKIPMTEEYFEIFKKALVAKKPNGKAFIDSANCQSDPHPDIVKIADGKLKIYCEMSDRAGNLDASDKVLTHCNKTGSIKCSRASAMNHFVLLPDGSLALCCNDFGLKHIVGNLSHQSYQDVMQGKALHHIFEQMRATGTEDIICRHCMYASEKE